MSFPRSLALLVGVIFLFSDSSAWGQAGTKPPALERINSLESRLNQLENSQKKFLEQQDETLTKIKALKIWSRRKNRVNH